MDAAVFKQRHSLAHILAQALQRYIDPAVQLGIGPAIDNGFYYDVIFSEGNTFTEEQLKTVTKYMQKIVKENQDFVLYTAKNAQEAKHILLLGGAQPFKHELLSEFAKNPQPITFYLNTINAAAVEKLLSDCQTEYVQTYAEVTKYFQEKIPALDGRFVTFVDMCEGPHVESSKDIPSDSFSLAKIAGAYWRGDEKNPMMTRIYGYAFETKELLKEYEIFLEEAKKRDHRVLGQKLKIFTISPLIGAGLPLMQPNGMIIRKEIEDYLRQLHKPKGYLRVWTPHIAKIELYQTSGHAAKFGDELFKVKGKDEEFCMKPMNCPHHMQIFADNQFSYRDMPIRYFEPATVYRDEKTGQLSGLTRVRSITQDDGHLFCRVSQIGEEVETIVHIIKQFYTTLGMISNYRVSLSVRGEDKSKYLGSDEARESAEAALEKAAQENDLPYKKIMGEAAFYGPKLDFMFKDAIGREWQLATIQADFNAPERFDLSFVNEAGEKERPVVIHRAISGSLERFMGVMIEHFAGAFPVWLAPKQVMIVPVAEPFIEYAQSIANKLRTADIRASVDTSDDSFSKKIRTAEVDKIPYILIVGEKEKESEGVSVREYRSKKQYEMNAGEFVKKVEGEYRERAL